MRTTQKTRLAAALDAARTSRRRRPLPPQQPTLRGMDQPVSTADIRLWVATVCPHVATDRWEHYARAYDVATKIARAKAAGHWPPAPPGQIAQMG